MLKVIKIVSKSQNNQTIFQNTNTRRVMFPKINIMSLEMVHLVIWANIILVKMNKANIPRNVVTWLKGYRN